jgi:ATP-binding cassette subfamily F protein 3
LFSNARPVSSLTLRHATYTFTDMALASARGLGHAFGAQDVFAGVTFEIQPRDRIALVGVNGAGKSTLLRILARLEHADRGALSLPPEDRVAYLPQAVTFSSGLTLEAYLLEAFASTRQIETELRDVEARLQAATTDVTVEELLARHASLQDSLESGDGYAYEHRVHVTTAGLGIPESHLTRDLSTFSAGQRTRAALARILLGGADLLLLDEPTNHLDIEATEWLESYLANAAPSVVVVSHDRRFLDAVATRTWEIADRELEAYVGNYTQFARQRAERVARARRDYATQQAHVARTEAFIRRYRAGVKSRQARGRQKLLDRLERVGPPRDPGKLQIAIAATLRAGDVVVATEGLGIAPDAPAGSGLRGQSPGMQFILEAPRHARSFTPLVMCANAEIARGDRVAIVGPNGAGKTTLLRVLMGEIVPVRGRAHLGYGVQVGYYAQAHEQLDLSGTVLSGVLGMRSISETEARTYLGRFLFTGDDVFKRVTALSGGERSRLALAQLALSTANVLILDEPTNHLDIYAREALEAVLDQFDGTVIFVSHDRFLIDGLATRIWEVADGQMVAHEGSWSAIRAARKLPTPLARATVPAVPPSPPTNVSLQVQATNLRKSSAGSRTSPDARELKVARERLGRAAAEVSSLEVALTTVSRSLEAAARTGDHSVLVSLGIEHESMAKQLRDAEERWLDAHSRVEELECLLATV